MGADNDGLNIGLMALELVDLLHEKGLKIAVAESCTGGFIAKLITDVPGASRVFECGFCTYSDRIKQGILGVSGNTLEKFSAVSKEVAIEMAENVRKIARADIGLSVTGYAGPAPAGSPVPVGLVFIGLCANGHTTYSQNMLSRGILNDRDYIRRAAVYRAILATLNAIRGY